METKVRGIWHTAKPNIDLSERLVFPYGVGPDSTDHIKGHKSLFDFATIC